MDFRFPKNTVFLLLPITMLLCFSSVGQNTQDTDPDKNDRALTLGIERTKVYIPIMQSRNIGVVANPTSVLKNTEGSYTHLVDTLLSHNIRVQKVFAPEHGFRGTADAGEVVKDGEDPKTGLPIISLYGSNKKPTADQLKGLDMVVFDIQDVGARFYTYISTLHYVMEACAEQGISVLVLDRPNPNGHYIDGPILEPEYKSFVGMHPVPVVHGMTIGEYAQMINGEHWLAGEVKCALTVIPMQNYSHYMAYSLPIKPSPNLPNDTAINLYPSLCFFESTPLSAGRGTDMQFQIFGDPDLPKDTYTFQFKPESNEGAKEPKYKGKTCYGNDLRNEKRLSKLRLDWLIQAYRDYPNKEKFFTSFFKKLSGTAKLQEQIEAGMSEEAIRTSWQKGLNAYDSKRLKYALYR